jgi:putative ABC transport system ATP-binding protein
VIVDGVDLGAMSEEGLVRWRGRTVGIVFQFFQLLPTLTALEDVALPMDFARR